MGCWAHDRCIVQKSDHDQQTYPKVSSKEFNNQLKECAKSRNEG